MKEIIMDQITVIADKEYQRASILYGKTNNSSHESYAIIKEEYEESIDEIEKVRYHIGTYWQSVKLDGNRENKIQPLEIIKDKATKACAELVQVIAMCEKAIKTEERLRDIENKDK